MTPLAWIVTTFFGAVTVAALIIGIWAWVSTNRANQELMTEIKKLQRKQHNIPIYIDGLLEIRRRKRVLLLRDGFRAMNESQFDDAIRIFKKNLKLADNAKQRCVILQLIAWNQYYKGYMKEALQSYLLLIRIAQENKVEEALRWGYNGIGLVYGELGDPSKGLNYLEKALEMEEKAKNRQGQAAVLGNIGILSQLMGDCEKSIVFLKKALKIHTENQDEKGEIHVLTEVGYANRRLGKYDEAIRNHKRALQLIGAQKEFELHKASNLAGLGSVYLVKEKPKKALGYLKEAYEINDRLEIFKGLAIVSGNIGVALSKLGKPESASKFIDLSLAIAEEREYVRTQAEQLANKGMVFWQLGDYEEALVYYKEAKSIFEKHGLQEGVSVCNHNINAIKKKQKKVGKTNRSP